MTTVRLQDEFNNKYWKLLISTVMHASQRRRIDFQNLSKNVVHFADISSCDIDSCAEVDVRVNGGLADNGFQGTPQEEIEAR